MQDPEPGKVKEPKVIENKKMNKKHNVKKKKAKERLQTSWSHTKVNERPQECVGMMQSSDGHVPANFWNLEPSFGQVETECLENTCVTQKQRHHGLMFYF